MLLYKCGLPPSDEYTSPEAPADVQWSGAGKPRPEGWRVLRSTFRLDRFMQMRMIIRQETPPVILKAVSSSNSAQNYKDTKESSFTRIKLKFSEDFQT